MGVIRASADQGETRLATRVLVGRAVHCGLRLDNGRVSAEHAVLAWLGTGWQVRDLGSRNGTWVDGQRLASGGSAAVGLGSRVVFGGVLTFEWTEVGPPQAMALSEAGERVLPVDGVLALPDAEDPEVTVFLSTDGWQIEDQSGPQPAPLEVQAGGRTWRLDLPEVLEATVDEGRGWLTEVRLELAVSRDEEHVHTVVDVRGVRTALEFRAHHYLLVTLARLRLAQPAGGWVDGDRLCRMLALDSRALNMQVYRARLELAALGIQGAAGLVERRAGGNLRLGITEVVVTLQRAEQG